MPFLISAIGFIIEWLVKKIAPRLFSLKNFFAGLIYAARIAYLAAAAAFIGYGFNALLSIYTQLHDLFDYSTSSSTVVIGSDGINDFNAIVWSMLDSYGILQVADIYLPLVFSNIVLYLTYFAYRMFLSIWDKSVQAATEMSRKGGIL
ncbi:hypothetical protein YH65_11040 [Sulfurovum lithotrophicum]|uniref:Uncharacterized protein n=1 Tax=Sulfurovum lithotrophicum TaxID=206403 RepID=A0A7U4RRK0_9BACT|nr:hypothetical protein [Sulfurovum lithotrophicum]AKF25856.1 hypothetical protein YH65_11040 [Sulfurovum lithotrophicum]